MLMSSVLDTWSGRKRFKYNGYVSEGTIIHYGTNFHWIFTVTSDQYKKMLNHFRGQEIPLGAIREIGKRPSNSLGKWIAYNVTKTAIASYVAPILVHERYCTRVGNKIKF
jgi:hypothetical protein